MKRIIKPERSKWKTILARPELERPNLEAVVKEVFEEIMQKGDIGVATFVERFQKFKGSLIVSQDEIKFAKNQISKELKNAIEVAASNIRNFHSTQIDEGMSAARSMHARPDNEYMPHVNMSCEHEQHERKPAYTPFYLFFSA